MYDSFVTPRMVASQVPLSMGFPRREYWSGLPFPTLRDLPNPGIEPTFLGLLHWQADSSLLYHVGYNTNSVLHHCILSAHYETNVLSA